MRAAIHSTQSSMLSIEWNTIDIVVGDDNSRRRFRHLIDNRIVTAIGCRRFQLQKYDTIENIENVENALFRRLLNLCEYDMRCG